VTIGGRLEEQRQQLNRVLPVLKRRENGTADARRVIQDELKVPYVWAGALVTLLKRLNYFVDDFDGVGYELTSTRRVTIHALDDLR
jgi:hypothetical protein